MIQISKKLNLSSYREEFLCFRKMLGITKQNICLAGSISPTTYRKFEEIGKYVSTLIFYKIKYAFKKLGYELEFNAFVDKFKIDIPEIEDGFLRKYIQQPMLKPITAYAKDKSPIPMVATENVFNAEAYLILEYPERIE